MKTKIEYLFKVISRLDFYINSTNTKSSIILAWNGLIIGILLLKQKDILSMFYSNSQLYLAKILLLFIVLCSILSNLCAFSSIFPFIKLSRSKNKDNRSLIFWKSIASMSRDEYIDKFKNIKESRFFDDICEQANILSIGLLKKMRNLQTSINIVFFCMILIFCLFILKLFWD